MEKIGIDQKIQVMELAVRIYEVLVRNGLATDIITVYNNLVTALIQDEEITNETLKDPSSDQVDDFVALTDLGRKASEILGSALLSTSETFEKFKKTL